MKIAIIGAGISGLSAARILQPTHEVVVFEKEASIGGLIKCETIDGALFHKVGGHVFNSKNQAVLDWFWSHFDRDREFQKVKRNAKVFFNGQVMGYPIENYIYMFPQPLVRQIIDELTTRKTSEKKPNEYPNFETFLREQFGDTLFNLYFKPYNEKIWRVDLSTVAMEWLEGKLPMPNIREIIISNILREEESQMVHSSFFYPVKGGSQFIVDRLASTLNIRTSTPVHTIYKENGKYTIANEPGFEAVIYCGDVRKLPDLPKQLLEKQAVDTLALSSLRSNGTSNLFCETDETDISWLYIPEDFTQAHRIIYTGVFAESNNGQSARKTCVVEFSGKVEYATMTEEIKKLPGNLTPLAHNYESSSYVIQDAGTRYLINNAKKVLDQHNFYLHGRFAEWEYYNMDKCIEASMTLAETIKKIAR